MTTFNNVVVNAKATTLENAMRTTKLIDEMPAATSAIPAIFIEMFFHKDTMELSQIIKQLHASSIFKTCYMMIDMPIISKWEVYTIIRESISSTKMRNNNIKIEYLANDYFVQVFNIAVSLGYLDELSGMYFVTDTFYDAVSGLNSMSPIEINTNRRVPYLKNGVAPSILQQSACDVLQMTAFNYSIDMAGIIHEVDVQLGDKSPLGEAMTLVNKCQHMKADIAYCTEVDMDHRGRMYNVAHYGPNAQKDDANKALYWLVDGSTVAHNSLQWDHLMLELQDVVGKKESNELCSERWILRVANNPVGALKHILTLNVDCPLQYIRMCIELAKIIKKGIGEIHYPVGLDAKCSGSQLYAILAGDITMLKSCGFSLPGEIADPYLRTINKFNELTGSKYNIDPALFRKAFKTPYMAVSYSGGVASLLGDKELMAVCPEGLDNVVFAKLVLAAIHDVFGPKIMGLIKLIHDSVHAKCVTLGRESFDFRMPDGAIMSSQSCDKIEITTEYSEIRYAPGIMVAFGSKINNTGLTVSNRVPTKLEFARKFCVNYIHSLDALVARTVVSIAHEQGLTNIVSIHDCFRVGAADVLKLKPIIQEAYRSIFIDNSPLEHLFNKLDINPIYLKKFGGVLNLDNLYQEGNFFFC